MAFFGKAAQAILDEAATAPRRLPTAPKKLVPAIDCATMTAAQIAEYREVAEQIGLSANDIAIEEFRLFLATHDIPTFNLAEVVSYMDGIAAKDNPEGFGWHWCPVRARDAEHVMTFGRPSVMDYSLAMRPKKTIASDFYESHQFLQHERRNGWITSSGTINVLTSGGPGGGGVGITVFSEGAAQHMQNQQMEMVRAQMAQKAMQSPPRRLDWRIDASPAYTRTIPLHALKKVALIEKEYGVGKVAFLVSDYTTAPHQIVNPDPFLMAVVPNSAVGFGKGRFVIDVWDEPGFGIARMVK